MNVTRPEPPQMLVRSLFADMLLLEHNGFNTGAVFNYHQTAF